MAHLLECSSKLCAALDTHKKPCGVKTCATMMWCPKHNEERIKLYINYKSYQAALSTFDQNSYCTDIRKIRTCRSLESVRHWNKMLRYKYKLVSRCIEAREYFTERFFGNDMDFGHRKFWRILVNQQAHIEYILSEVEGRAYHLILTSQNALWVLNKTLVESLPTVECSGYSDEEYLSESSSDTYVNDIAEVKVGNSTLDDIEDPVDVALRQNAEILSDKIHTRLARYYAPQQSKFYKERLEVIDALVRRVVYVDPSLMVASQKYESVMSFLQDGDLEVTILSKLWTALKELRTDEVRAAVDDVLHPKHSDKDYVELLGGRVYKLLSGNELPFHAWGHLTSVLRCYSCLRKICTSVDEIIGLTRYAILTRLPLNQSYLKCYHPVENAGVLMLCGSLINSLDRGPHSPRFTIDKYNAGDGLPQWSETETNIVICMGLSLRDPMTREFVSTCEQQPHFMVLSRAGREAQISRSVPTVWCKRTRRARTRAGLSAVPWEKAQSVRYFLDTILQESFPITSPPQSIEDCYQLAVIDTEADDIKSVIARLAGIWKKVYRVECVHELNEVVAKQYVDAGELELAKDGCTAEHNGGCCAANPYIGNTETYMTVSYKQLWKNIKSYR